jgi:RHS repeat-associated protein
LQKNRDLFTFTHHGGQVLSNESKDFSEVYFDDFRVRTAESYIVQQTDYYAYGLISRNWNRLGEKATLDLFQSKNYNEATRWYDFHARQYDAALGRWFGVDALAYKMPFHSPYVAMGNSPLMYLDPDGNEIVTLTLLTAAVIGGGLNLWSNASKVKDFKTGAAYFFSGAAGGVTSVLGTPVLGGTLTSSLNVGIDIATGNLPNFNNPAEVAKYVGFTILDGLSAGSAGSLSKSIVKGFDTGFTSWKYLFESSNKLPTLKNPALGMSGGLEKAEFSIKAVQSKPMFAFASNGAKNLGNVGKGSQTIIGEGMKRVSVEAAKRPGSIILNNMPKFTGTADEVTSQMMTYNRKWILQQMRSGRPILDIGLDATRTNPSIFYQMEQNMIKNYLKLHPNAFKVIKP